MIERERLIELLTKSETLCDSCGENSPSYCIEAIADFLLANGVIVPPCKVGDTVYFTNDDPRCSAEIDGIHIDEQGVHFGWVQYDVGVDITELWDEGEFDIDEIGKTVFLTFEEFEKALAERSLNNEQNS